MGGGTKRGFFIRLSTRVSRSHAGGDFHARTRVLFLPLSLIRKRSCSVVMNVFPVRFDSSGTLIFKPQYQHSYSSQSSLYIRWENLKIVEISGDHFVYAHVLNARQAV